jgi:hypothetical protein
MGIQMAQRLPAAVQMDRRNETRPKVAGGGAGGTGQGGQHGGLVSGFVMFLGWRMVCVDITTAMWDILEMNDFDLNHRDL